MGYNEELKFALDEYSKKYNLLAEKMENAGINCNLLEEVLDLKIKLTKTILIMKMDKLFKI